MVVAACWGSGTTLSDYALTGVTALQLLLVELVVATALVWIVALVGARGQLATPRWRLFVVLGIVEPALVFLFANLALARESAATAALLFGIESVFTAVLAVLVLRERISRTLAMALMLLAPLVLVTGGASGGAEGDTSHWLAAAGTGVVGGALPFLLFTPASCMCARRSPPCC